MSYQPHRFTRTQMTHRDFFFPVRCTSHQIRGKKMAHSSGHNSQRQTELSEISVFTFQFLYNWRKYKRVLCTNLIHARQFMKSQVYDSPLWCTMTCFGACLYPGGTHYTGINRIWQRPVWPIWFRWPTQEPVLATHNPRKKSRERLKKRKKKKKEWTGSDIGIKKADIPFV